MQVSQPPPRSTIETVPELPNQGQALRLLEAVVFCIGQTQSHFDARAISDQILGWVEESHNLQTLQKPLSLQILVILAIGQLFVGEFSNNETVPGQDLFEFVLRHVPTLGNLYALGRLGIELPALIAVYLQNSNRKEEAYLYVSTRTMLSRALLTLPPLTD